MLVIPETHKRVKKIIGGSMVLGAFFVALLGAVFVNEKQLLLITAVCSISIAFGSVGTVLLVGRTE